jgi:hypothetical protein
MSDLVAAFAEEAVFCSPVVKLREITTCTGYRMDCSWSVIMLRADMIAAVRVVAVQSSIHVTTFETN